MPLLIKFWKPIAVFFGAVMAFLGFYIVGRKDGSKKGELKIKDVEILTQGEIIKNFEDSKVKENEIKELYDKASDLVDEPASNDN